MTRLMANAFLAVGTAAALGLLMTAVSAARGRPLPGPAPRAFATTCLLAAAAAFLALEFALLTDDFSIAYVADNHARSTPLLFSIATAWAALEGSIVLWCLVLAFFTWLFVRSVPAGDRLGMAATAVIAVVAVFFFGLVLTVANPFGVVANPLPDGPGPNPLLLNHPLMAVHPPLLYLGYIAVTIPFGLGLGALLVGDAGAGWLIRTRNWALLSWVFLTAGIGVGALWSYEVLGWGGYWSWDPVENASLMPWLVLTAFLHSSIAQVRRGALSAWNVLLVIATFSLTILGTFLTRSGVVASVHSFTQSEVGPALLGFFVFVVVLSLALMGTRVHLVSSPPRIERMLSREGAFLANNLLFTLLTLVVLLGTTYPILLEAFTGQQVSVGRPFFDRFAGPIGLLLLLAMAVGSVLPYRALRPRVLWNRLQVPVIMALAAGAATALAVDANIWLVSTVTLAALVCAIPVSEAARRTSGSVPDRSRALARMVRSDRRYWGGQLGHVGFAVLALGVVVSGILGSEATIELRSGEVVPVLDRALRFDGLREVEQVNRTVTTAAIAVIEGGAEVAQMSPGLNTYPARGQSVASPSVRTTVTGDLYLAIREMEQDRVVLEVFWWPMQWIVWVGVAVMVLGGAWALSGRRRPAERLRRRTAASSPLEMSEEAHA